MGPEEDWEKKANEEADELLEETVDDYFERGGK